MLVTSSVRNSCFGGSWMGVELGSVGLSDDTLECQSGGDADPFRTLCSLDPEGVHERGRAGDEA